MSTFQKKICMICRRPESESDGDVYSFGYRDDQIFHLKCINSPEGKNWIKEYRKANSTFDFYWTMISWHNTVCQNCKEVNGLFPKMRGHSPEWEACCDRCDDYTYISPYLFQEPVGKLCEIMDAFFKKKLREEMVKESVEAVKKESFLNPIGNCDCGGIYSITSKPRCRKCKSVISNSLFHFTTEPKEDEEL